MKITDLIGGMSWGSTGLYCLLAVAGAVLPYSATAASHELGAVTECGRPSSATAPTVFAPGVISGPANDSSPTFTPRGDTVFFARSNGSNSVIVTSRRSGGWSSPIMASFSGTWRDLDPALAPDGSYLIFASNRPLPGTAATLDGLWGGTIHPGKGGNLWRVDRTQEGWSAARRLPDTVNRTESTFGPAIVADGSIYFSAVYGDSGRTHLFRAQFANGRYAEAAPLPFTDDRWSDAGVAVAPDESFMIFSSTRPPTPTRKMDLFIAFRERGRWRSPQHLPDAINCLATEVGARLGPDGHTLYFTSGYVVPTPIPETAASAWKSLSDLQSWNNGLEHIWQVDIGGLLRTASRSEIGPTRSAGNFEGQRNDDGLDATPVASNAGAIMQDVSIILENRPGALAEMGEALGRRGISIEGGGAWVAGGVGTAHFLFRDGAAAKAALEDAGIEVVAVRDVVVQRLKQAVPGQLGQLTRQMAEAGVNIDVLYSDHDHQLVLVVDNLDKARAVSSAWARQAEDPQ